MKRGGKRREGMGWDLACPSSGEEGCPGMSGCRERQTVVSTVVRCCLRGVKWVLPPWEVDWLVPMGQATAVMAHQAENKQDTPASGKTNQHVHSSRPNRMRSKVQLCLHVSVTSVCCGRGESETEREIGPHTRTTGQQDNCELRKEHARNEDPGGVVQPSSAVLYGTVEEK
jgi:hypothetical protein